MRQQHWRHRRRTAALIGVIAAATISGCSLPNATTGAASSGDQTSAVVDQSHVTAATSATGSTSTLRSEAPSASASTEALTAEAASAQKLLQTLPVKGRAPKTGYSREQFGQSWTDDVNVDGGHNGCDTRNDVLRRDLTDFAVKPGTHGCVVLTGTLHDPYTGTTVPFTRGKTTSSQVQIDHMVALADAWQKGAQQLTPQRRADLANDPRNLQATVGTVNQSKGAGDAATWLPPNKAYRCTYVARQIEVKAEYDLWVTAAEKNAMAGILQNCGRS